MDSQHSNGRPGLGQAFQNMVSRAANSGLLRQVSEIVQQELPHLLESTTLSAAQVQELAEGLKWELANLIAVCNREQEALGSKQARDLRALGTSLIQLEGLTARLESMLDIYADSLRRTDPRMAAISVDNDVLSSHAGMPVPSAWPRLSSNQSRHIAEQMRAVVQGTLATASYVQGSLNGIQPTSLYIVAGAVKHLQSLAGGLRQGLDRCYADLRISAR